MLVSLSALSLPHTHTHLLLCPPSPVGLHTFKRMSQEKVRDFPFFSPSLSLWPSIWVWFLNNGASLRFIISALIFIIALWKCIYSFCELLYFKMIWIFCIWQDSIFLLVFKGIVLIMQALLNRQILLLRWNFFFFYFNYSCLLDYWICSLEALYADKR